MLLHLKKQGAWERDKNDNFPPSAVGTIFTNSVVDVFSQLAQCFEVLKKLDCPDLELWGRYMSRFARTIFLELTAYLEMMKSQFGQFVGDERICCFLMNNVHHTRLQLEKVYEAMGGQELPIEADTLLKDLQVQLNETLDELAQLYSRSLAPRIERSAQELAKLLAQVKAASGPAVQQSIADAQVAPEADMVLAPLMDVLDGTLSVYVNMCEKTVLKRILKEMWRSTMLALEKIVVLPPSKPTVGNVLFLCLPCQSDISLYYRIQGCSQQGAQRGGAP